MSSILLYVGATLTRPDGGVSSVTSVDNTLGTVTILISVWEGSLLSTARVWSGSQADLLTSWNPDPSVVRE